MGKTKMRVNHTSNQMSHSRFRSSPEWRDHRLQVLERDDNKCTCCGLKYSADKLQVHHKDLNKANYYKLDNLDDFVSLCSTCHKCLHAFEHKVRNKKRAFTGESALIELVMRFFK